MMIQMFVGHLARPNDVGDALERKDDDERRGIGMRG